MGSEWSSQNFRDVPVFPSSRDILDSRHPFLEASIVNGSYRDVDHYLQVQFSLLREDFLRPLREIIAVFRQNRNITPELESRIHTRVQVLPFTITNNGIEYDVRFLVKNLKGEKSKRLIFGSLLCFSADNFVTVGFATVSHSTPEMLQEGKLRVRFEHNLLKVDRDYSRLYVMIDAEAYFEAYRYFLTILQEIGSDSFPLKEYIVSLSTKMKPPKHAEMRNQFYFTEECTHSIQRRAFCPCKKIRIHNESDWDLLDLDLDYSQKEAVKAALTQSLSIIQGPPGTGKTHVGLCIVKILLFNRHVWSPYNDQCPILIVCATNHALNQFLEKILKTTQNVVRIGGQSKCAALTPYNITTLKQNVDLKQLGNSLRERKEANNAIEIIKNKISELQKTVNLKYHDVVFLGDMYNEVSNEHLGSFRQFCRTFNDDEEFCYWLDGGKEIDKKDLRFRNWLLNERMDIVKDNSRDKLQCVPLPQDSTEFHKPIWNLSVDNRWRLYRFWLDKHMEYLENLMEIYKQELEKQLLILKEVNRRKDVAAIRGAHVIGLTTTGAAKFNYLIKEMKSKIVIVEEAAEVLEAHIVTSLCKDTQHLILIGDHQQLRPSPTVYELGKVLNMEISLFERLVRNGVPFCRLHIQHRMKPCISRLLVPHIYKDLKDHPSVSKYENIKRMEKSMFFVSHNFMEDEKEVRTSHINEHELDFLAELSRYLLLQGYQPSQIVILTTYNAQLNSLRTRLKGSLKDVTATCVDNFQGEESDIVLLSFVRSNEEGNIGFLKTENRICVALSRAKRGLYCIGNFTLFERRSKLWRNIVKDLKESDEIGSVLNIQCERHGNKVPVKCTSDFTSISDGGCGMICDYKFPCGHFCLRKCHPDFKIVHSIHKCEKDCERIICKAKHKCPKRCWELCDECSVVIVKVFPECLHVTRIPCFKDTTSLVCKLPCYKTLKCGHNCSALCSSPCGRCNVMVEKALPCQHTATMPCFMSPTSHTCKMPCLKRLDCGHKCNNICSSPCGKCNVIVVKRLPTCRHTSKMPCSRKPTSQMCGEVCERYLSCGHKCYKLCSSPCGNCQVLIEKVFSTCQHKQIIPCWINSDSLNCEICEARCCPSCYKCAIL